MRYTGRLFGTIVAVVMFGGTMLGGCSTVMNDCVEGSGKIISAKLNVGEFTGIKAVGSMKVYVTQGDTPALRIEADDNIMNHLEPHITGGDLTFNTEGCLSPSRPIAVYVTMKSVERLSLNGSGSIIGETPVTSPKLAVELNGSGKVQLQANVEHVGIAINGSGTVSLGGSANHVNAHIEGSGDVHGYNLRAINTTAVIEGSGDIETTTMNILDATIKGSGDIFYKGNPETVKQNISGSGSLKKRS